MIDSQLCSSTIENILKVFSSNEDSSYDFFNVSTSCERFCSSERRCRACVKICDEVCYWNAVSECINNEIPGATNVAISLKPGKILCIYFEIYPSLIDYKTVAIIGHYTFH